MCEDSECRSQGLGHSSGSRMMQASGSRTLASGPSTNQRAGLLLTTASSIVRRAQRHRKKALRISPRILSRLIHSCTCCTVVVCIQPLVFVWRAAHSWSSAQSLVSRWHTRSQNSPRQHRFSTILKLRPLDVNHHHHVGQAHPVCRTVQPKHAHPD